MFGLPNTSAQPFSKLQTVSKDSTAKVRFVTSVGRIPIFDVNPVVDGGEFAAKAFDGEILPFSARVFREGHDNVSAELVLTSPAGAVEVHRMAGGAPGTDLWHATAQLNGVGLHTFHIRAFEDRYLTWHHNAEIKIKAGSDVELMLLEGVRLFESAIAEPKRSKASKAILSDVAAALANLATDALARLETMCLMAGLELPLSAIREQLARAIDLVVHITRRPDGARIVTEVVRVNGVASGEILIEPVLVLKEFEE